MQETQHRSLGPEWAYEFHGHRCPFPPSGFRLGQAALAELRAGREQDHTLRVIARLGEGHPQTCLADGIQIALGTTFGKTLIERPHWGKLAATFWYPGKTAVRFALKVQFLDPLGTQEFFAWRKRGLEPSATPAEVAQAAIDWTLTLPDNEIFAVTSRPAFSYKPRQTSFNKSLCTGCGEQVFERFLRLRDGKPYCIPCAGYGRQGGRVDQMVTTRFAVRGVLFPSLTMTALISAVFGRWRARRGQGGRDFTVMAGACRNRIWAAQAQPQPERTHSRSGRSDHAPRSHAATSATSLPAAKSIAAAVREFLLKQWNIQHVTLEAEANGCGEKGFVGQWK